MEIFSIASSSNWRRTSCYESFISRRKLFFNLSYSKGKFIKFELNKIFRQKDEDFIKILNHIRVAKINQNDLDSINKRVIGNEFKPPKKTIILSPTNRKVDIINNTNLNKITSKAFTYTAVIEESLEKLLLMKS